MQNTPSIVCLIIVTQWLGQKIIFNKLDVWFSTNLTNINTINSFFWLDHL
jgi:hypothetical protein